MSELQMSFPEVLADILLRSTILLGMTACVCLAIRGSSASLRHLVWFAGLSGALLLPALSAFLPDVRVPVPAYVAGITSGITGPNPVVPGASMFVPSAAPATADALATNAEMPDRLVGWGASLLLLWAAGTLLLVLRLFVGVTHVRRLRRKAIVVEDGEWIQLSRHLGQTMGLRREVAVLTGSGGNVPMTWGVFRPVVWLPMAAAEWTPEHLRDVLAHELAHVRRRDALTRWIGHITAAVYWFNPLVWWAVHRLQEDSEHACDDAVLTLGSSSVSYAEHLLKVVRSAGRRSAPAAAMAMARSSGVEQRVRAILDPSVRRDPAARGAGVLFAAAVVLLPLATLRPARVEPEPIGAETVGTSFESIGAPVDRAPDQNAESAKPTTVDGLASPGMTLPARVPIADAGQIPGFSPPALPFSGTDEFSESTEEFVGVTEEFTESTGSGSASRSSSASSSSTVSIGSSSSSSSP